MAVALTPQFTLRAVSFSEMNPIKLLTPLLVMELAVVFVAATPGATPTPVNGPIYYGRPNNGGYPYTTPPPVATKPSKNETETPTPVNGPIYYGRPNNGGYPYTTPPPVATKPSKNETETPTPVNGPIYYGRPNNGGYPYTTPTPQTIKEN
uniref:Uncharacterized protein n=1 Tax=Phytophthora ramorum TaxID=164328 RepID=H3H7T0_PHYRM